MVFCVVQQGQDWIVVWLCGPVSQVFWLVCQLSNGPILATFVGEVRPRVWGSVLLASAST